MDAWTLARSSPGPSGTTDDELSAIQHAMNLRLQDERAFWAEYQNQPLPQEEGESDHISEYKRKKGERAGLHWRVPTAQGRRQVRHIVIDTNCWESFVHARLAVAMGDPGSLSLFGRKPGEHQPLAEHLTAECRVRTDARGRIVDEWKIRAGVPDNLWLDCLVGCAVAASILGAVLPGTDAKTAPARAPIRLCELRRSKR